MTSLKVQIYLHSRLSIPVGRPQDLADRCNPSHKFQIPEVDKVLCLSYRLNSVLCTERYIFIYVLTLQWRGHRMSSCSNLLVPPSLAMRAHHPPDDNGGHDDNDREEDDD